MPVLAPANPNSFAFPYASRFNAIGLDYTNTPLSKIIFYRQLLDRLGPQDFIWRPYLELDHVPDLDEAAIWTTKSPIIRFTTVEMHQSDRVKLQFGMHQGIPDPPEPDCLGRWHLAKVSEQWYVENYKTFAIDQRKIWARRSKYVLEFPVAPQEMKPTVEYVNWYRSVTNPEMIVSAPFYLADPRAQPPYFGGQQQPPPNYHHQQQQPPPPNYQQQQQPPPNYQQQHYPRQHQQQQQSYHQQPIQPQTPFYQQHSQQYHQFFPSQTQPQNQEFHAGSSSRSHFQEFHAGSSSRSPPITPDMGIEEEYPQYTTFDQPTSQYTNQPFDLNTPPQPLYFNQTGSTTNFQNFQAAPTRRNFNPPRQSFDSAAGTRLSYGGNSRGQGRPTDFEDPDFIEGPSSQNLGNSWPKFVQFVYWSIQDGANIDVWSYCQVEPAFKGPIGSTWSM
ncbi:uncharacterized protein LOC131649588 [Vicia villosa]|uniref:uncharacterized protein LOC131649588 n=1 Tax=Vicia villosa TaxID=3911 RepID=UPI00273AB9AB|nr:uncharacterized protein LOC131649588 [Vicia villosa]